MNRSSSSIPSGTAVGRGLSALRSALDEFRDPTAARVVVPHDRDDVRGAVLAVLAEQPSDGYRIVRILEERGAGEPTPAAGSVYPTLQLLADEGLATASESDGRKTWTLTAAGRAAATTSSARPAQRSPSTTTQRRGAIARSGAQLGQTVALAVQAATPEQIPELVGVLDDARRRVLAILARG